MLLTAVGNLNVSFLDSFLATVDMSTKWSSMLTGSELPTVQFVMCLSVWWPCSDCWPVQGVFLPFRLRHEEKGFSLPPHEAEQEVDIENEWMDGLPGAISLLLAASVLLHSTNGLLSALIQSTKPAL